MLVQLGRWASWEGRLLKANGNLLHGFKLGVSPFLAQNWSMMDLLIVEVLPSWLRDYLIYALLHLKDGLFSGVEDILIFVDSLTVLHVYIR